MSDNAVSHTEEAKLPGQLLPILWLYIGVVLLVLLSFDIPIAPAEDTLYEICGLIVSLVPLVWFARSRIDNRRKQESMVPALSLWIRGFLLILCAVALANIFALSLRFLLPGTASASIGAFLVNAVILLLKWTGIGFMAFGQLSSPRQEITATENGPGRGKSKLVRMAALLLMTSVIIYLLWNDLVQITEYYL